MSADFSIDMLDTAASAAQGSCPETDSSEMDGINTAQFQDCLSRPLQALGITVMEECAYRALLAHNTATASEIAEELTIPQPLAIQLLGSIEEKGLATHSPKTPRTYVAAPPEFTIDSLIKQRQAMLEQARLAIPDLAEQAARSTRDRAHEQILELITSQAQLKLVVNRISMSFQTDQVTFQRAPILVSKSSTQDKPLAGARVRTISDTSFLDTPGALDLLRHDMARGEEARTVPSLPFKMMIADRNVGLITLVSENPETAPTLLIHRSALLEALYLLFEFVWEKATPILSVQDGKANTGSVDSRLSEAADTLLPLLAAGLNDKAILHEVGISAATLNRRLSELMKAYGTRTRFQLGWRAALDSVAARSAPLNK